MAKKKTNAKLFKEKIDNSIAKHGASLAIEIDKHFEGSEDRLYKNALKNVFLETSKDNKSLKLFKRGLNWSNDEVTKADLEDVPDYKKLLNVYQKTCKALVLECNRLYKLSVLDNLTGLYNMQFLNEKISELNALKIDYVILVFDLDNFKNYNIVNGHIQGNKLIKKFSQIIVSGLREKDIAARFGGDEFIVLLPNTEVETAVKIAHKIRRNVAKTEFGFEEKSGAKVTTSIGVCDSKSYKVSNAHDIVKHADNAMYDSKEFGKNCVRIWSEER